MRPPELRQLRYFVAVAEDLSFTRAARRLHLVQQALSGAIAQMEDQLEVRLFDRTTRRVELTEAGRALLPHAREALAAADRGAAAIADVAVGLTGRIRVGLAATAALAVTPELFRRFGERYARVQLDVRHFDFSDPSGGLHDASTDVAIVRPPFSGDELDMLELDAERRFAVFGEGHALAGEAALTFDRLLDEPWMDADTDRTWCDFWRVAERRTRPAPVGAVCMGFDELFEAARRSSACSDCTRETASRLTRSYGEPGRPGRRLRVAVGRRPCGAARGRVGLPGRTPPRGDRRHGPCRGGDEQAPPRIRRDRTAATPAGSAREAARFERCPLQRSHHGVGVGYVEAELRALGVSLADRGARTDEYLAAMRMLWDDAQTPSFEGRFVSFADVIERPQPVQRPHPPIVVGGHSAAAYRRAIQVANGWYGWELTPEQAVDALDELRQAAIRYERPAGLGELEITITPPGPVDLELARRYADAGVHRLVVQPDYARSGAMDELIASIGDTLVDRV